GGETNVTAYLDSVWVEVEYQEAEKEEEFELRAFKKDWRADETPTFEIVSTKEENIIESLIGQISSIFEEEPKIEAKLDKPDGEELPLQEGEDFIAETHSPTKITIFRQKDFQPGLHKLQINFEKNSKVYNLEEDFTWGVLAINVNKSIYLPGDQAYLQMAVLDDAGHTICDANLNLEIFAPNGSTTTLEVQKSGECGPNSVTYTPDYYTYYN
ncbi:hypothetical protein GW934_03470, partial [Candidatus Falkowbacteria bacterium]|nr:hypothetical protein [Candidatus Falkowbacteria bacterium]